MILEQNRPMPGGTGHIYVYTTPAYARTRWRGARRGSGLIKVGYTTRDPHTRIREQIGASSPEAEPYRLLLQAEARTRGGKSFTDKAVHRILVEEIGAHNVRNEWFEASAEDVRQALKKLDAKKPFRTSRAKRSSGRRRRSASPARKGRAGAARKLLFPLSLIAGIAYLAGPEDSLRVIGMILSDIAFLLWSMTSQ